jgi:hypothetical protein
MLAATFIAGLRPLESSTKEAGRARLRLLESSQKDAGCYVHRRAKAVRIEHKRSWLLHSSPGAAEAADSLVIEVSTTN